MGRWLVPVFFVATAQSHVADAAGTGDAAAGEALYSLCIACHRVGADADHAVGPQLNGVFGIRAGTQDGYRYSSAMRKAGEYGLEWDAASLDAFLASPETVVPRNKMRFDGMDDAQDRADLLAYLERFSGDPVEMPETENAEATGDHQIAPEVFEIVGDPEYGAFLASECTACHHSAGQDSGIPSITNWPVRDFVIAMHGYKTKRRDNEAMQMIAGRLSDEEIAALAAYFAAIDP